jgi:hypothetical protein
VEIEDAEPTVEQVVAYDRFWRLVIKRILREREAKKTHLALCAHEKVAA